MFRTLPAFTLLLSCLLVAAAPGKALSETSLHMEIAAGQENTIAYDLYLQHEFAPFCASGPFSLAPILNATLAVWDHKDHNIWSGTLAASLRLYFHSGDNWLAFVSGSFGGALLSRENFGDINMGCRFQFRTRASAGLQFGETKRHSLEAVFTHFSNGRMAADNSGYNSYGMSYGFRF